jgi:hypothetical protein
MYRNCIFCSADLGSNDSLERFPVGRNIACDAAQGRLWAICPRCARWNLAPLEERWEAIEDGERLFRDTRLRAQSENVGLAQLRDGTRLIRVGEALPGELALWRYGTQLARRHLRASSRKVALPMVAVAGAAGLLLSPAFYPLMMLGNLHPLWEEVQRYRRARQVAHRVPADASPENRELLLRWRDLGRMRTGLDDHGEPEVELMPEYPDDAATTLGGPQARQLIGKALLGINREGAPRDDVEFALRLIGDAGGAEAFVRRVSAEGSTLARPDVAMEDAFPTFRAILRAGGPEPRPPRRQRRPYPLHANSTRAVALEMALHEETERQALDGELSMLEAMWREAEEIAAIADRLPDHLPPAEPPRV